MNKLLVGAIWVLTLSSCTLYRDIPIDVLRTAEVKLPEGKHQIALFYRNFKYPTDTLQNYYLENESLYKDRTNPKENIDSMAVTKCLTSVAKALQQNGVCQNPVIFPVDLFPRQSGEEVVPLSPDLIKKLGKPAKADYLVSLETFTYFFSHSYEKTENEANEFQQVRVAGIWTLFDAATGEISDKKTMLDTVYWNNQEEENLIFPPRIPAIEQAAEVFGENYAKRFYSGWTTVDRQIIIPPLEDFRLAEEYVNNQQWDKAAEIWEKYADRRMGRLAVSACYNLALAHEISDDITGAVQWINSAMNAGQGYNNSREWKLAGQYQSILIKRQKEIEKDQQNVNQ